MTRTCRKCGETKSIEEFPVHSVNKNGSTYYRKKCKACAPYERRKAKIKVDSLPWEDNALNWSTTVTRSPFDDIIEKDYRKLWESYYGEIPKGWHIHHIDGNHSNNDIHNLCCVPPQVHYDIHFARGDDYACSKLSKQHSVKERTTANENNDLSFSDIKKILVDLQHSTWRTSGRDKDRPQMWKDMASGIAHAIQHLEQLNKYR